ncbi:hypothetical protein LSTR_LSTR015770 [Laodelphax striatellus]|uniref:Ig-like domain-containing protein n=1 Tax=Laodelphax striatellus TaxID=195883 RepID=A0A482WM42_LAOST|nr:hypothetical protein LSTR_LSTR015770 [Laodelphax striatellus]
MPEDYEVPAGNTATFRCTAVSDSTLDLSSSWLNNGNEIDFDAEPRFVKANDYSLTITKTNELDSGTYVCVAKTELDQTSAQATLIVQGRSLDLSLSLHGQLLMERMSLDILFQEWTFLCPNFAVSCR